MIMNTNKTKNSFRVSAKDFKKIPGSPIAYWSSQAVTASYALHKSLSTFFSPVVGVQTGCNEKYLRYWNEVSYRTTSLAEKCKSISKWVPCNKGGGFRRWYGNNSYIINWENNGLLIKNEPGSYIRNPKYYFREGMTWSSLANILSMRYTPAGYMFETKGSMCFSKKDISIFYALALINSNAISVFLKALAPTLDFHEGPMGRIPFVIEQQNKVMNLAQRLVSLAKFDWDSYETSWDFQTNPLCIPSRECEEQLSYDMNSDVQQNSMTLISERYARLRGEWQKRTEEMRLLEIENNRIFIEAYGLQDELSPEVPWNEITLTCNPWYRYGKKPENADSLGNSFHLNASAAQIDPISKQEESCSDEDFPFAHDTEQRLLEDTIKEYISYAVGCMMGRYSPEKPGLILANQGESIDDYHKKMGNRDENITNGVLYSESTTNLAGTPYTIKERCGFSYHQIIDCDGVIPILDEEWFIDDIVAQFKSFLKFTFGMEHFADNLDFIEKALGKDIRKYFIKDFYKDHVQRYKKRPIYWMFSSPKGSFNALIYMHRYRPDTVSIVLNEYLREFISKIRSHREHLLTENNRATLAPAEKTRNLKLIDKYAAMLTELDAYEHDILYPLAQQKIAIDLDDGVKVNYCKFGAALKKIPGLEAKEE